MSDLFVSFLVLMAIVQSTLCVLMIMLVAKSEYHYYHLVSTIHHKENMKATEGKNL